MRKYIYSLMLGTTILATTAAVAMDTWEDLEEGSGQVSGALITFSKPADDQWMMPDDVIKGKILPQTSLIGVVSLACVSQRLYVLSRDFLAEIYKDVSIPVKYFIPLVIRHPELGIEQQKQKASQVLDKFYSCIKGISSTSRWISLLQDNESGTISPERVLVEGLKEPEFRNIFYNYVVQDIAKKSHGFSYNDLIGYIHHLTKENPETMVHLKPLLKAITLKTPQEFCNVGESIPGMGMFSSYIVDGMDADLSLAIYKAALNFKPQNDTSYNFNTNLQLAKRLKGGIRDDELGFKKLCCLWEWYYKARERHSSLYGEGAHLNEFAQDLLHTGSTLTKKLTVDDLNLVEVIQSFSDIEKLGALCHFLLEHNRFPFDKDFYDFLLQVKGNDIVNYVEGSLNALPIYSTSGIQELHTQGHRGQGVTIAVCDSGLENIHVSTAGWGTFKARHTLWNIFNQLNPRLGKSLPLQKHAPLENKQRTNEVVPHQANMYLEHHARTTLNHLRAIAPGASILPVELGKDVENWKKALTNLAQNPDIHLISIGLPIPGGENIDPQLKEAFLACAKNGKAVVLEREMAVDNETCWNKTLPYLNTNLSHYLHNFDGTQSGSNSSPSISKLKATLTEDPFWASHSTNDIRAHQLFADQAQDSPLSSHTLVVGTSLKSPNLVKKSVQNNYVYINGDHKTFFHINDWYYGKDLAFEPQGSSAVASGIMACLWSAAGLQTPGSQILSAVRETGEKDETVTSDQQGRGKMNPLEALKKLQ